MALTNEIKETLFRSSYLTRIFQMLLAAKERSMRNEARKLISDNNADEVYHEASANAYADAQKFAQYAQSYYNQIKELGKTKDMLIDALADFEYAEFAEGASDVQIINEMSVTTYSPVQGVELNIFELLVDQTFQEWKLKPIENNLN